ncbi:hypothetical protein TSOC_003754 [Tetrabaena socialis]|uniref:Integrase zinc-binding domain-containing protein n=1 Tax=Tetrabaena socialis TaxID=47790 RepID=A0A2J8AAP3_9CHLO|nr:hypothetical protein TSOC_003754 [Tetrabaena socialis]|eukprot:PNH09596.1 hypothetical protein TSOC_003754 [Tetrabaena socialis]
MHGRRGHLGVWRMLALLQLRHWWYGMRQGVQAVVRECHACDLSNARGTQRPMQLHPLPASTVGIAYQLLYGGTVPVVPPAAYPAAAGNLLIAQHRDTLRYSAVRTGRYLAKPVVHAPIHDTILRVESLSCLFPGSVLPTRPMCASDAAERTRRNKAAMSKPESIPAAR